MKIEMSDEFYYRIKQNDEIYNCFNTSKENVLRNNEKLNFYAGEWVKIKVNDYLTHIVKPVENIEQIAKIHDITVEDILKDNNLQNSKLFIGQRLKIYKEKTH